MLNLAGLHVVYRNPKAGRCCAGHLIANADDLSRCGFCNQQHCDDHLCGCNESLAEIGMAADLVSIPATCATYGD